MGTYANYVPWHQVTRGEPSSRGRSHLISWGGRHRELLSDGELVAACFAVLVPHLRDLREQFPLALDTATHELAAYDVRFAARHAPGTRELADALKIRHPLASDEGVSAPWVMSTDFLLTLTSSGGHPTLLAVAYKTGDDLRSRRTLQKLRLEREYWLVRGVPWLLVTPHLFDASAGLTLRMTTSWLLTQPASIESRRIATEVALHHVGRPLQTVLAEIGLVLGDLLDAQCALWQAMWASELPIDLRRGWRPHEPLELLTHDGFVALNPIASRRSAWTS